MIAAAGLLLGVTTVFLAAHLLELRHERKTRPTPLALVIDHVATELDEKGYRR